MRKASQLTYTKVFLPHDWTYLVSRPRTIGITLSYAFEGEKR